MIQLVDRGPDKSLIRFTPRHRFRSTAPTLECELISGHFCPWCANIIQAFYTTTKPVDLSLYEETRVISQGEKNEGELLKIVPGEEGKTAYKDEFFKTPKGNSQRITLKNHVVNWKGTGNRDDYFEPGERCCIYTSVISMQGRDMAHDLAIVAGYNLDSAERYIKTNPTAEFIVKWLKTEVSWSTLEMKSVMPVGVAPPALLIKRSTMKSQFINLVTLLYSKWDAHVATLAVPVEATTV
jgi:hypothetical protein